MPETGQEKIVKLRIKYDKGSQMLSQCNPEAQDSALLEAAMTVASLRQDQLVEIVKITETDLVRS